jgi:hypothetical protein
MSVIDLQQQQELRCVIPSCAEPVTVEVHGECYGTALERFCGYSLRRIDNRRRPGEFRIFLCEEHLQTDPRAWSMRWQAVLFC